MADDRSRDNIYNIDGTERYRGNRIRKPRRRALSFIGPEHVGALIFFLILVYLLINLYIYRTKDETSIYEVVPEFLSSDDSFKGIAVRNEQIVYADHTGNISYYIGDCRRVARNGVVFSIDNGSDIYEGVRRDYAELSLSDDEIAEIKQMISRYMTVYDSMNIEWVSEFQRELGDTVADRVNANMVADMEALRDSGISRSAFYVCRSGSSGVISYTADSLTGIGAGDVTVDMFDKGFFFENYKLRHAGLVDAADPVYRICRDEQWNIVCKVTDVFYLNHLEDTSVTVFLDDSKTPIDCAMSVSQSGSSFFATLTLDSYMSEYCDKRFLNVRFDTDAEEGLKIPVSSVVSKPFYLVPLTCFAVEDGFGGYVLRVATYDSEGYYTGYRCVYPSRYYSDGFYAYIDTSLLSEGDMIVEPVTDHTVRVSAINYLDGVYSVGRGYYQFVRIEKLRQNSEYAIVSPTTPYGLRRFDRIALDGSKAVEDAIIY